MSASDTDDTVEMPALDAGATSAAPWTPSPPLFVDAAGLSHQGKVRAKNEDHFLIARFGRFLETIQTNVPQEEAVPRAEDTGYALLVADGVGGGAAGDIASKRAISTMVNLVLQTPDWILRLEDASFSEEVLRRAAQRYAQINTALTEQAQQEPDLKGFATTMTMAWSMSRDLFVAHIGDSRAYLFNKGRLRRLTRDHTLAQAMADRGVIAQTEVAAHHMRHILLRAIGATEHSAEPDALRFSLDDGDGLLVCTDGLTEMVPEQTIAEILARDESAEEVCQNLVDAALQAGGKDNVTVAFARYDFSPEADERS